MLKRHSRCLGLRKPFCGTRKIYATDRQAAIKRKSSHHEERKRGEGRERERERSELGSGERGVVADGPLHPASTYSIPRPPPSFFTLLSNLWGFVHLPTIRHLIHKGTSTEVSTGTSLGLIKGFGPFELATVKKNKKSIFRPTLIATTHIYRHIYSGRQLNCRTKKKQPSAVLWEWRSIVAQKGPGAGIYFAYEIRSLLLRGRDLPSPCPP